MKKTVTLILLTLFTLGSYAQKNLFENLNPFEGQEFKVFHIKYNSIEERFYIQESDYEKNVIINIAKNGANKPVGLNFLDAASKSEKEIISYKANHSKLDHYTQPAYAYTDLNGKDTYLMIGDIFFAIEYASEDMSEYGDRSGYGKAYVPLSVLNKKTEKTEGETEKKKVSFKDKFKNLMETPIGGTPLPEALKQIKSREEFEAKINNYLAEMRKKQAANPYTAQDKKEMAAMDKEAADIKAGIQKANNDYWQSEEGQRVLGNGSNMYTVKNTTGKPVSILEENGTSHYLMSNDSYKIFCDQPVYLKSDSGSKTLISSGKNVCGQTISF